MYHDENVRPPLRPSGDVSNAAAALPSALPALVERLERRALLAGSPGALDPSFGPDGSGRVVTSLDPETDTIRRLLPLPGGNFIAVGRNITNGLRPYEFITARYL